MNPSPCTRSANALPRLSVIALAIYAGLALSTPARGAPLDIAQVPPTLGQTLAPNILYIHDDSGSMSWAYMPDDRSASGHKRYTSSTYNRMYFNPNVTYTPPVDHTGASRGNASYTAAWENGYLTNRASYTRNLQTKFRVPETATGTSFAFAGTGTWPEQEAFYHDFDTSPSNCNGTITDNDCYVKRTVTAAQQQNFANWYSYYRTREMTSKAGISLAFDQLGEGARVGYGRINDGTPNTIDGKSITTIVRGVRPFVDDPSNASLNYRKQFFDWLFGLTSANSTPLRRALDAAGQYYENDDASGPWSTTPGDTGGNMLACRKSFTILLSDGYWNGNEAATTGARENNDGTEGNPFADTHEKTLADVAMYYWNRDLSTIDNKVPPTTRNPATWQHMATYTIGLGFEPTGILADGASLTTNIKQTVFGAIASGSPTITWPAPAADSPNNIADLLHAAVNGRGDFFSANNPEEFSTAMQDTLASIANQTGAVAPLGQSSSAATADTLLYQARFDTRDWSGWLTATKFNPSTGALNTTEEWTSSLPAHGARNILTYNTGVGAGRTFQWANLSTAQQGQVQTEDIVNWVRGDQSQEEPTGPLRKRTVAGLMGDIVNSTPLLVASRNYGYGMVLGIPAAQRSAYLNRINSSTFKQRNRVIYVGANDGMLHGFNAGTYADDGDGIFERNEDFTNGDGAETFAYVPAAVLANLPTLADPEYTHRYFVDGNPTAGDAYINNTWTTVLVGSTGAGGRSYFALDIEDPNSMTASKVMWEYTDSELGLSVGQATIARTNSGDWVAIFGNGYNSNAQRAQLFIVNLSKGTLLKKIDTGVGSTTSPNGMATPLVVDINLDGNADLVYAGDYQGNLWKIDLTSNTAANWGIAFQGKPLFKATDSAGNNQPITARPTVRRHPTSGLVVYFGTGKILLVGDQGNHDVQAFYGVFDTCGSDNAGACLTTPTTQRVLKSELVEQDIFAESTSDFGTQLSVPYRLVTQNPLGTSKGFFITLLPPSGTPEGERIISPASVTFSDRVVFTTLIPNDDPCDDGTTGWIMELEPFSGGRTDFSVFDMNADGSFNADDQVGSNTTTGRKLPGGGSATILHGADKATVLSTRGGVETKGDDYSRNRQSWQQIR